MTEARDPLDIGEPRRKAWEEFRVAFAAAFQHVWLLDELEQLAPDYIAGLEFRFFAGFLNADGLARDDSQYDGAVPIQYPDDRGVTFYDHQFAELLYEQLFPNGQPSVQHLSRAYGLALVGLHATLESFAQALGALRRRSPLPSDIRAFLTEKTGEDLDAGTADLLSDLDATRHILVHNRGIVDADYIRRVKDPVVEQGEYRPLTSSIVRQFAQAAWRTAAQLRDAAGSVA